MPPHRFTVRPGTVVITFHPPIPTSGLQLADRERLTDRVRETIASALVEVDTPVHESAPAERIS
jgi:hypothetical protein